jgi:hypothetical protein
MKKVLMAVALTAFIGSYSSTSFAQDGDKKTTKTEKKSCDKKKSCCSKDKKKSCDKKKK